MKEYGEPKHTHLLPWFCWCVNSDNGHQIMFYAHKDKINRKIYKKRARRKSKKIIKEQQDE
jgi:hypothetical protein